MSKRKIIKINEEKCTGCGLCANDCPEGAIQIIDGKARLISETLCDGLGACISSCPEGAIEIKEIEAKPYNEIEVIKNIIKHGKNTLIAHLKHLKLHGMTQYLNEAVNFLLKNKNSLNFNIDDVIKEIHNYNSEQCTCPASQIIDFKEENFKAQDNNILTNFSELRQWPIQLHLISPYAPYFQNADLIIAADCTAFAFGNFHKKFMKGKTITIACPKLDQNTKIYIEKIITLINEAKINTIMVIMMEVPCCGGLFHFVKEAMEHTNRKVPIKKVIISIAGEILKEEWI
ncbi:MAG: 4Fe-4S binding protein [Bacteroidales bacterium]|nr:4Fe-4S binding protein [Bacteroidales bacterium]